MTAALHGAPQRVVFYATASREVVLDELADLDDRYAGFLAAAQVQLEQLGRGERTAQPMPGTDGLLELKFNVRGTAFRILLARGKDKTVAPPQAVVVALAPFKKNNPKLPKAEQKKAEQRMKDWKSRHGS